MRYLLGFLRLLIFFLSGWVYVFILAINALIPGNKMKRSFNIRQNWAKNITRWLGVVITLVGSPPSGGHIFVANHRSYLDAAVILKYAYASIVAKAEVGSWPLVGWALKLTYTVLIKREDPASRKNTREQVSNLLEKGYSVIIFPEGTTFEGPGIINFKPGPFQISESGSFSIAPVAIEYSLKADAWVGDDNFVGHFITCFGKWKTYVSISFGPELQSAPWQENHEIATQWINAETTRLHQLYAQPHGSVSNL
jgi:1-acyl-sn-glycerol-3-phosphate acyltransferase